ncbi:MAG: hypothetical protein ABSC19_16075 [Syntrophorhabdales bacterium]
MTIYFANTCFTPAQAAFKAAFLARFRPRLSALAIGLIDPLEHTPNVENDVGEKVRIAPEIAWECLRLLEESDVIVALVDGDDTGKPKED